VELEPAPLADEDWLGDQPDLERVPANVAPLVGESGCGEQDGQQAG
jgi:hypothetical protein